MKLFLELQLVTLLASGVLLGHGQQLEAKDPRPYQGLEPKPYNPGPEPSLPESKAYAGLEPKIYQGPVNIGYQGLEPVGYRGPEPKAYQGPGASIGPDQKTNKRPSQK